MRYLGLWAIVCAFVSTGSAVQAQTTDPQLMAPINRFLEAFNKGDMAGAAATQSSEGDLVIIDEVPPFMWRGAQAFKTWADDLTSDDKKHAYVVVAAAYSFKQGGVAMRETAQMTFALKKDPAGWLIHAWTWTGPKAQKISASSKKKKKK
jgi:hypothetical protein